MTFEGCVVRMADTIAYIGRDIEDAIRLNLIKRSELPHDSVKILGNTNGTIVFNLVTDIIQNSFQNEYVAFSEEVSVALRRLKRFNLERIYLNHSVKKYSSNLRNLFRFLFEKYLGDIERKDPGSVIFSGFLNGMSQAYTETQNHAEIVRDFIAGMTDEYFLSQCPESMRPIIQRM
jgi:dGTPase